MLVQAANALRKFELLYSNELSLAFTSKSTLVKVWVLFLQVIVKVKWSKENNRPHLLREQRMTDIPRI